VSLALEVGILCDSADDDIACHYASRLPGEARPVANVHFHPVEPRSWRPALRGHF
jgi:hypothetical protein